MVLRYLDVRLDGSSVRFCYLCSPRFTQWFGFGPLKILPLTFQVHLHHGDPPFTCSVAAHAMSIRDGPLAYMTRPSVAGQQAKPNPALRLRMVASRLLCRIGRLNALLAMCPPVQVYVDMYNVSSRGSVHIKSANAIHSAEWDTGLFSNPEDLKNLVRVFRVGTRDKTGPECRPPILDCEMDLSRFKPGLMSHPSLMFGMLNRQEQVLPVADSLRANGGGFYKLVSPPRHLLTNKDDKPLIHVRHHNHS